MLLPGLGFGGRIDNDAFKITSLTIDYSPGTPRTPTTPVPEPGSLGLMGCGLAGVAAAVRRRRPMRQSRNVSARTVWN